MKVDKFVQIYDSALQEHEQQVLVRFSRSETSVDPADIPVLKLKEIMGGIFKVTK